MTEIEHPLERIALVVTLVLALAVAIVMSSDHDGLLTPNSTGFAAGKSPTLCPVQLTNYQLGASGTGQLAEAERNAIEGCKIEIAKKKCPATCPSEGQISQPTIYGTEEHGDFAFAYAVCYKTCNYGSKTDIPIETATVVGTEH